HRMFVLENTAADPFEGEWIERGQIDTGWESFALDATSVVHHGQQYLVWSSSISTSRAIPTSTSPGCTTPGPWPPRRSSSAAPSTTGRSAASGSTRARPCWFVTERSI